MGLSKVVIVAVFNAIKDVVKLSRQCVSASELITFGEID